MNTAFLTATGTAVGDSYTLASGSRHVTVRIAGEILRPGRWPPRDRRRAVHPGTPGSWPVRGPVRRGAEARRERHGLRGPGQPGARPELLVNVQSDNNIQLLAILSLVVTLTLLLAAVAGRAVLNTAGLQIWERVHDLGVFKAVGITPQQTTAMAVCSVAGIGLVAGLAAVPARIALHHYVLPVMGHAAQTAVPASVLDVYWPWELILLALAGLVIAVAGGLAPAGWAARTRTAFALCAE